MDLAHAVRRFEKYLDDYDREDDKIRWTTMTGRTIRSV